MDSISALIIKTLYRVAGEVLGFPSIFRVINNPDGIRILHEMKSCEEVYHIADEPVTDAMRRRISLLHTHVRTSSSKDAKLTYIFDNKVSIIQMLDGSTK